MKKYSQKEYIKKYQALDFIKCDICGNEFDDDDWEADIYELIETEVRMKKGYCYPDSGDGIEYNIDICPVCFKNKLIPWVESYGMSKIKKEEWDY